VVDVKDLCLGALTYGDATGYDIKKFFESTFSHCFLAGYGSIYPALAELTGEKLVTARTAPGQGGPSRKVYHLTEAGRKAFLAQLKGTVPQHKVKSEFLVLMYFAHLLPPAKLDAILDKHLADIERKLKLIQAHEHMHAESGAAASGARFVGGFGKAVMTAASEYIRTHRRSLRKSGAVNSHTTKPRTRQKTAQAASRNRGYTNA
jgi:PadR family transcriptional regulator, regulatory protein AphA